MPTTVSTTLEYDQSLCRKKKKTLGNPLQNGILSYLIHLQRAGKDLLVPSKQALPKRFTLYAPLLLLPVNFPSHTELWRDTYCQMHGDQKADLFCSIAHAFTKSGQYVTHVAIGAPIPRFEAAEETTTRGENVLRSPRDLVPIHGDFGPSSLQDPTAIAPSVEDFDAAFWVTTKQSQTVSQVWAPRWTMFSRGNATEKNRILGENSSSPFDGLIESELGQAIGEVDVLDMYVGIGYFAFSYLARGVKRVWGWDLNPWSIKGLRRGCEMNGWRCLLVRVAKNGSLEGTTVEDLVTTIRDSDQGQPSQPIRCVAFCGDNQWSAQIMGALDRAMREDGRSHTELAVRHVNLGLLPTSAQSWAHAVAAIDAQLGGWLHVHENVNIQRIDAKSQEIMEELRRLLATHKAGRWQVRCQHVEQVKTYGPGVVHCVFDVLVEPQNGRGGTTAAF